MRGPAGYYNIGNLIGLCSGLILQVLALRNIEEISSSFSDAVDIHFVGSPGATALSSATIVFLWAGEIYHRTWRSAGNMPDARLNRWAGFVSAIGAVLLAVTLAYFGDIWLALTSTILLGGGKLGSAIGPAQGWPVRIESRGRYPTKETLKFDLFRSAVILSRVPAIGALAVILITAAISDADFGLGEAQSVILHFCFALWTRADILLARSLSESRHWRRRSENPLDPQCSPHCRTLRKSGSSPTC